MISTKVDFKTITVNEPLSNTKDRRGTHIMHLRGQTYHDHKTSRTSISAQRIQRWHCRRCPTRSPQHHGVP
eukprot:6207236-Amphidinium_carterae.1